MHPAAATFRRRVLFAYNKLGRAFQAHAQSGNVTHAVLLKRYADTNACNREKTLTEGKSPRDPRLMRYHDGLRDRQ